MHIFHNSNTFLYPKINILLILSSQIIQALHRKRPFTIAVITCFCYVLIILLDHKKVRFSHLFQMCSKSISNDIIRFSPFCSNENMRFSYIPIILSECNKSRWWPQIWWLVWKYRYTCKIHREKLTC